MGSVCNGCGLPTDLCVCQELAKEETRIVVRFEKRRFNKPTTIIEGLAPVYFVEITLKEWLKSLLESSKFTPTRLGSVSNNMP